MGRRVIQPPEEARLYVELGQSHTARVGVVAAQADLFRAEGLDRGTRETLVQLLSIQFFISILQ